MTKLTFLARTAAVVGFALVSAVAGAAQAQAAAAKPRPPCFSLSDWHGWSSPSRDVLYMKIRNRDVYRLDLAHGSNQLRSPGTHLVSVVRGSDRICTPIDLDLRVSDGFGIEMPIRAKTITKLTPEEIAAIPKKDRP
ncbi:DUF6491 family protein [Caulobacter henricii]|uniref:Uncharacterized protein n=1 Tax=Caulobacter henricii TaxID=69395 RepID=A0A0N7JH09_9CAUL|nr:DUF6491 family protein [Caulobacter henricii]ALL12082.1 hypothetical protein AQ619_01195 [Caulobacter henricii]